MNDNEHTTTRSLKGTRFLLRHFTLAVLGALILSGCGGGGGGGGGSASAGSPATSTTAVVGSGGGTVALQSGASVIIDPGVVNDGTTVTIATEPAPASSSAEITPISPVVQITIPAGSLIPPSTTSSGGITVKIPVNSSQQSVVSGVTAATAPSNVYRYVQVTGQSAANAVGGAWTMYAKIALDTTTAVGAEIAVVKIDAQDIAQFASGTYNFTVNFAVDQFIPNVPTAGELFAVNADGTFTQVQARIDVPKGKLPLVLVHGIQLLGCEGNVKAYMNTWQTFAQNFYANPELPGKYQLYSFSYQTDRHISGNGQLLAQALQAVFGSQEVVVVAHSMGGLVTRSAMLQHADIGANIGGVIMLGTPNHGTTVASIGGRFASACFWAMTSSISNFQSLSDGANDMAWDNFDDPSLACTNSFLCGPNGLNVLDNASNESKYIVYAGNFDNSPRCVSQQNHPIDLLTKAMCVGDALIVRSGKDPSDGAVPVISAIDDDYVNGKPVYNTNLRVPPRIYPDIDHLDFPTSSEVFNQNPHGSAGGLQADLLDLYASLIPAVHATAIGNGATGVGVNTPISATFSEAIDASTLNASTFTLTGPGGAVAGTVTYNASTDTATFTPSTALAYSTTYTATITTGVTDTSGNPLASNYSWSFTTAGAVTAGEWTWEGGSSTAKVLGVYGTLGQAAPTNVPGARASAVSWTDAAGNLWLFGGGGFDSTGGGVGLNDLWQYIPATGEWTWEGGSSTGNAPGVYGTLGQAAPTNVPGARWNAVSWTDAAGNLWLFGGADADSTATKVSLNDLWKYTPATSEWTWESGSCGRRRQSA